MKPGLLELLACPLDAQPLTANGSELACAGGHRFPIRDDVPRLVPGESGPLGDQTGTSDSFSAKWERVDSDEVRQRFDAQYAWYVQRFGFGTRTACAIPRRQADGAGGRHRRGR